MDQVRLSLRHLRSFLAVADAGSVTGASEIVHVTQSAVTQAVARLEAVLGATLFERRPRGMSLTPTGRILEARARAAFRLIDSPAPSTVQMDAFLAVADAGSYAAAAALTGQSEAGLHRSVTDLAFTMREPVFERRGRGLALTTFGRNLARRLRLGRAELRSAVAEIIAIDRQASGRIVIGAMPLSRSKPLPATLAAFRVALPSVEVAVIEGAHNELMGPLRDGDIDIVIGALRDPTPGPDVRQHPLFEDRPAIAGRPDHPLARLKRDLTAEDLLTFPWIMSRPGTPLRILWDTMFAAVGRTPPRVEIECGSMALIRDLLVRGDYLTLISPIQIALELKFGWLTAVADPPGDLRRTIGVTTRTDWRPTSIQRRFLEILETESGR
jgi:LysR family transcriptional regulator of gallate degradation